MRWCHKGGVKKIIGEAMEKEKKLFILIISLLTIMILAICIIGYSAYQMYYELAAIRNELSRIDYEFSNNVGALNMLGSSIEDVYKVLYDILIELRY